MCSIFDLIAVLGDRQEDWHYLLLQMRVSGTEQVKTLATVTHQGHMGVMADSPP